MKKNVIPLSDVERRIFERKKRLQKSRPAAVPPAPEPAFIPERPRDEMGRFTAGPKGEEKKRQIFGAASSQDGQNRTGIDYSTGIRKKLQGLYDLIQDRGLYIGPEKGIQYGLEKTFPMNDNESENISLYSESYNSTLLLTILSALTNKGTMIFFGPPGAGKTTTSEIVGHFLFDQDMDDIYDATIYGNPELTREEMIARLHTGKLMLGKEEVIPRKFTSSPVKRIDEINRIPPGNLSSLYLGIDAGLAKYYEKVIRFTDGPIYATANAPDSGNWPLPPPVKDRFDLAVVAPEMNPTFLEYLENRGNENLGKSLEDKLKIPKELKLGPGSLKVVRESISEVEIEKDALNRLMFFISEMNYCEQAGIDYENKTKANAMTVKPGNQLCGKCHYSNGICACTEEAISPRSFKAIVTYTKALAWWRGKKTADTEDVKQIIPYAVWHKLSLTDAAKKWDSRYANDRVRFIRDCFDEAQKLYDQSGIPNLGDIMSSIAKSYSHICEKEANGGLDAEEKRKLKEEIEGHLGDLKNLDAISKIPIAVGLKFVYERIK